jgi:peptidoglycan hydrolase CwlO-like protein
MDVERTVEFLLKNQARTDVRLDGITKLLRQGMRMVVKTQTTVAQLAEAQKRTESRLDRLAKAQHDLAKEMKELAKAQKETERTLRTYIRAQRNGRNGH